MSPTLNRTLEIQQFERSDMIEICDGIIFDLYMGLPHVELYMGLPHVELYMGLSHVELYMGLPHVELYMGLPHVELS